MIFAAKANLPNLRPAEQNNLRLANDYATPWQIDVESFGAKVIVALNVLDARYGFSDTDTHAGLMDLGFTPIDDDPFSRGICVRSDRHEKSATPDMSEMSKWLDGEYSPA